MKDVPEIKVHLHDLKDLYNAGYEILDELRQKADASVVKARFLHQEVIAVYGASAAKKFYNAENFKRSNSMPTPILKTLQGQNGVQTLDGKEHYKRKEIFMNLMTPDRMEDYRQLLTENLTAALDQQHGTFELYSLTKNVLFRTICSWSGIDLDQLSDKQIQQLADDQVAMFEGTVNSASDHMKGLSGRKEAEKWAQELIKKVRQQPQTTDENSALYAFANARDTDNNL